jgi:nicotinate-nucleotide adenylyltransferase
MTIGVFGGTFNPPHVGHLIVMESVQDQLSFDRVLFIPSANPPHKKNPTLAPSEHRFAMTKLAIDDNKAYEVSDLEIQRVGTSYTIDTLKILNSLYPSASLSLIIGADNFVEIDSWRSPEEIFSMADVLVMSRPGFSTTNVRHSYSRHVRFVNVPSVGISGSDIRRRIKQNRTIRYLVPDSVLKYIHHHRLYRE